MADQLEFRVNDEIKRLAVDPKTPLLYILTNDLLLKGPRFGCGLGQCGACSVLVDGVETRSCLTPAGSVTGKAITTLEGLPKWYQRQHKLASAPELHPLQQAIIDEQAVQCGYCYNGQIIKGAELLAKTPEPTESQIRAAMNGHLCRCGTYPRLMAAIQRASKVMVASKATA
jgi:aerobic-type carbon monoxide dehydrogenase small subunit (CoxS/CutS family)